MMTILESKNPITYLEQISKTAPIRNEAKKSRTYSTSAKMSIIIHVVKKSPCSSSLKATLAGMIMKL